MLTGMSLNAIAHTSVSQRAEPEPLNPEVLEIIRRRDGYVGIIRERYDFSLILWLIKARKLYRSYPRRLRQLPGKYPVS
jgi:hypothetical protein